MFALHRAERPERAPTQAGAAAAGAASRLTLADGSEATLSADWEIWGPCGGYVAALALRAAGAESPFARPASFFCHYLSVAAFAPVDEVADDGGPTKPVAPVTKTRISASFRSQSMEDARSVRG